jgi:hypothetical protein
MPFGSNTWTPDGVSQRTASRPLACMLSNTWHTPSGKVRRVKPSPVALVSALTGLAGLSAFGDWPG